MIASIVMATMDKSAEKICGERLQNNGDHENSVNKYNAFDGVFDKLLIDENIDRENPETNE